MNDLLKEFKNPLSGEEKAKVEMAKLDIIKSLKSETDALIFIDCNGSIMVGDKAMVKTSLTLFFKSIIENKSMTYDEIKRLLDIANASDEEIINMTMETMKELFNKLVGGK